MKGNSKIYVDGFSYNGTNIPALKLSIPVFSYIENKVIYEVVAESSSLLYKNTLYNVGMCLAYDIKDTDVEQLPESVKKAGRMVFDECKNLNPGSIIVYKDAICFNQEAWKNRISITFFRNIKNFGINGLEFSKKTRVITDLWIPKKYRTNYIIVPEDDGKMHDTDAGIPLKIIRDGTRAIKKWMTVFNLTKEQARKELMGLCTINSQKAPYYPVCEIYNLDLSEFYIKYSNCIHLALNPNYPGDLSVFSAKEI